MSVEQLQTFAKGLGLEQSDIDSLNGDVTDFNPYIDKIKGSILESIKNDTDFIDSIVKPYKDAPIGKEKQLKKEVRKYFGLQFTEDELSKMQFVDILKKGTEHLKNTDNTALEDFKNKYSQLLEENERIKNEEIPAKIKAVEDTWRNKINEANIKEELIGLISSEKLAPAENLSVYSTAFIGYLAQIGLKIHIDEKKYLSLRDVDGVVAKNADGGILKVKDALTDFSLKMSNNIRERGNASQGAVQNGNTNNLLSLLGKGFN